MFNPAEDCDDGNAVAGDGCDAACAVEAGYTCNFVAIDAVPQYTSVCAETCGDGLDVAGTHVCDDGNPFSGDGCSEFCTPEAGYVCDGLFPTTCTEDCDGNNLGGFLCDDGNAVNGDGCLANCAGPEPEYHCTNQHFAGLNYCEPICGDGIDTGDVTHTYVGYGAGNFCDDGNRFLYLDGCDRNCEFRSGFQEVVAGAFPVVLTELCNDFPDKVNDYLACEDGNAVNGDGCTNGCEVEYGWECGQGDPLEWDFCKEICGDGHNWGNYMCDDGNYNSGDGCSQLCYVEKGYNCTYQGTSTIGQQPNSVTALDYNDNFAKDGTVFVAPADIDAPNPDICVEMASIWASTNAMMATY